MTIRRAARRARLAAAVVSVIVAAAVVSCSGGDPAGSPPSRAAWGWLAVVSVADRPEELDPVLDGAAEVLGGALIIAPVTCYEGVLGKDGRRQGYLLGVAGPTREEAERLARSVGLQVSVTVPGETACVD